MNSSRQGDQGLLVLAERAGLAQVWQDIYGETHEVKPDVLQALLQVLGLACGSPSQIRESLDFLERESSGMEGRMIVVDVDQPVVFRWQGSLSYRLVLEDGAQHDGMATRRGLDAVYLPAVAKPGYHKLFMGGTQLCLAVAPRQCPSVSDLTGSPKPRIWGISAQIYSLRRDAYGGSLAEEGYTGFGDPDSHSEALAQAYFDVAGAGDYAALAQLVRQAAQRGAGAVGISPVHAMFSADPQRYSPYAPSSRLFLNASYVDPGIVFDAESVKSAMSDLASSRTGSTNGLSGDASLIDWPRVLPARLGLCWHLHEQLCQQRPPALMQRFDAFRRKGGAALESHANYEALHAHFASRLGPASGWQQWPHELHNPNGMDVRAFVARNEKTVQFHVFLQWLAHEGMRAVHKTANEAGMPVGLISDLAIGTDPSGSHAWSCQGEMLTGVSVGAPPDLYQAAGQNWGLSAFSPLALRAQAYGPFLSTLRAALAYAGGVRIDHILGLARMWVIPDGAQATDGVYLRYPLEDLLRLIALESSRHGAMVVGENLGTVPEGFNEEVYGYGILGTSVLWFERQALAEDTDEADTAAFRSPDLWPPQTMATSTTHDLPTIEGWWQERDLLWRRELNQIDDKELADLQAQRHAERVALWRALQQAQCVPASHAEPPAAAPRTEILAFVAKTPAPLVLVPLEDLLGLPDQANFPGTTGTQPPFHPNWLQRLPSYVEELFEHSEARDALAVLEREREAP
jgi:4-alpha-glucanotransferase